jgi:RimJ/RimL family protein N-acetyltransferase
MTGTSIPDLTIEALARGFCREAATYGFTQIDYVKFVNVVLDMSMRANAGAEETGASPEAKAKAADESTFKAAAFPLQGPNLVIREFDATQDLALFDRWLADPGGRYFLLSRTTARQEDLRDVARSDTSILGVITLPDGRPIGSVAFLNHDPAQHKAELRKLIGEADQRGKGLGKEASMLWIRYGLGALGLHKIYLSTLHTNSRNVRLNEELGFRTEGILRNEVLIDGVYHDVLRMGLSRD